MEEFIKKFKLNKCRIVHIYHHHNKKLAKSIIEYVYLNINKIIINKPKLINLLSFVPLPTYFKTQEHLQNGIMFPVMLGQCENASCYGAPTTNPMEICCPTCKDVKMAYLNMYWNIVPHKIIQCSGKFIYV